MQRNLKLPKNIREKNGKLMLDFNVKAVRYRVITTLAAEPQNIDKGVKLLNMIMIDIERNQFFIANYERQLVNVKALLHLDAHFERNQKQINVGNLIEEHEKKLIEMVNNGNMEDSTYQGYRYAIKNHLKPFFDGLAINQIDPIMLEDFISTLKFSRRRINLILNPIKTIMDRAFRQGLIDRDPFNMVDNKIYNKTAVKSTYQINPFTQEEILAILSACRHECIKNLIQFGFWTGCRIGEIFALEWCDIDFNSEIINISKSATTKRKVKDTKTAAGMRSVEMTPKAKEALLAQFEITGKDNDRVFKSPMGMHWVKISWFAEYWRNALKNAGVKYRNPYQMRHTFISHMLLLGNSPMILYRQVGHKTPKITYEKYARFIKKTGKLLKVD